MHKTKEIKPEECAINKNFESGSCFSIDELKQIANDYNTKYPNDKIQLSNNKEELVNKLQEKLQKFCPNQTCWATLKFINNNDDLSLAFKPEGPPGQFEWLSTTEINDCMERFMKKYPSFLFVGAVPIDIQDLDQFGVKSLKYDKLIKKGKTQIGIIFNLDEHYKSGSHWVAFYIDFNKKSIYYSDSAGQPPEKRVKELVKHIVEDYFHTKLSGGSKINLPIDSYMNSKEPNILEQKYDIRFNTFRHQFGGSECGVYSINFITRLLRGETFDNIHGGGRISDKEINVCRKTYFNGYDDKIKLTDKKHIC